MSSRYPPKIRPEEGDAQATGPEAPPARGPITIFVCGRRGSSAPPSPRFVVPRGREVPLAIDAMPKPKRPPGRKTQADDEEG